MLSFSSWFQALRGQRSRDRLHAKMHTWRDVTLLARLSSLQLWVVLIPQFDVLFHQWTSLLFFSEWRTPRPSRLFFSFHPFIILLLRFLHFFQISLFSPPLSPSLSISPSLSLLLILSTFLFSPSLLSLHLSPLPSTSHSLSLSAFYSLSLPHALPPLTLSRLVLALESSDQWTHTLVVSSGVIAVAMSAGGA